MKRKVHNKKGFSLVEVLVVVLLLGIVMVGITSGAGAVQRSYNKIILKSDALTLLSTLSTAMNADLMYAKDIKLDGEDVESFYSSLRGVIMNFNELESDGAEGIGIHYINNKDASTRDIFLIPSKNYTYGLKAKFIDDLQYIADDDGRGGYFKYELGIFKKNETNLTEDTAVSYQEFCVRPVV